MLSRRTLLLKPMQTAVSGYARLQKENGRAFVQLHARGLPEGEARLFGCVDHRTVQELGSVRVNANGEASLEAETPESLRTLLLVGMPPRPLLIGLCAEQDAGSLLEARNAALALCDRLAPAKKKEEKASSPAKGKREATAAPPLPPKTVPAVREELPREVFLPAIDPARYAAAVPPVQEQALPTPAPEGPPADRLRPLVWPRGFSALKAYFETGMPVRLFLWPGWRFVRAAQGLFIGMYAVDGRVRRIAYACTEQPPNAQRQKYHPVRGLDGQMYQVLEMKM